MPLGPINPSNPVNWHSPLNRGLIAWWFALPGIHGGRNWTDLAGKSVGVMTTTDANFSPDSGFGAIGNSAAFGGTSGYVRVPIQSKFMPSDSKFTIAFWGKRAGGAGTLGPRMAIGGNGGTPIFGSWVASYFSDDKFYFLQSDTGASWNTTLIITPTWASSNKEWHHFVITNSGASTVVYLDNEVKATLSRASSMYQSSIDLTIGAEIKSDTGVAGRFANGSMNDCRIYARALSAGDIGMLYREGRQGFPSVFNRIGPRSLASAPAGGPFPWYLDQSAMSGGLQTMGL